jgi:mannose-6-phosphate isomerase-like protein (cupin superfamily)
MKRSFHAVEFIRCQHQKSCQQALGPNEAISRTSNPMKRLWLLCMLTIPLLVVVAQEGAPAGFEQWTAASLKQDAQKLRSDAATDPHHFAVELLADFPNESAMLVHRESDGQAELHETQADIFFVQSGSATLVVGGTLVNGETVAPHEKRNGTIQGGVRQKLSAGDIIRIPARAPHQLLLEGAPEFNYFVIKIKGY